MIYIRNDDVAWSTELSNLMRFCDICDQYPVKIVHGVTVCGDLRPLYSDTMSRLTTEDLDSIMPKSLVFDNKEVCGCLAGRSDLLALHGYYHYHPPHERIELGRTLLEGFFEKPVNYFIPPFNEMDKTTQFECDGLELTVLDGNGSHLEEIISGRESIPAEPDGEFFRCHSWRFGERFSWRKLDAALKSITSGAL